MKKHTFFFTIIVKINYFSVFFVTHSAPGCASWGLSVSVLSSSCLSAEFVRLIMVNTANSTMDKNRTNARRKFDTNITMALIARIADSA